jgi:cell division septation protein DedD
MGRLVPTVPDAGVLLAARDPSAAIARRYAVGAVLALLLLPAGCGMDSDFDSAARRNTAVAWDDYLRAHPDGPHSREARARLAALLEDRDWQRAHVADSADAYERYLRSYPQGAHAHDALVAIATLNLARTPTGEAAVGPPASSPATGSIVRGAAPVASVPAKTVPAPAAIAAGAATPAPATDTPAGYRVQLGAFTGAAAAERAWHDLVARHPDLTGRTPVVAAARAADGRSIQRLQVAGLDRAGAEALCRTLVADRDPCVTVPPLAAETPPR